MMKFGSSGRPAKGGRLTRTTGPDADRKHPGPAGHRPVASLGIDPEYVPTVAATGRSRHSLGTAAAGRLARSIPESGRTETDPVAPPDRQADLLMVITALTKLLDLENDALRKHRYTDVKEHTERKKALTRAYLEQIVVLRREPELSKSISADHVEKLKEAGTLLEQASRLNENLLRAGIVAGNTFMGAVADAVREMQEGSQAAYSESGRMDGNQVENRRRAIALNKEF